MTADKYVVLLDTQERAEGLAEATPALSAGVVRQLLARGRSVLGPASSPEDWSWLPTWLLAADAPTAGVTFRSWRSPDGVYLATLVVGPRPAEAVRLTFGRGDQEAGELAGQSVSLGGVVAVIDPEGNADLPTDALRQARREGKRPTLTVGGVTWPALEEGA